MEKCRKVKFGWELIAVVGVLGLLLNPLSGAVEPGIRKMEISTIRAILSEFTFCRTMACVEIRRKA